MCACMDRSGGTCVKVVCVHIAACMCLFKQRCSWDPWEWTGLGQQAEVTLQKEKGGQKVGWHGHHHSGCMSLERPLPLASALSMTLKYFHLLWELPDQLPVVLGIFFFSFFFFFFFNIVIL